MASAGLVRAGYTYLNIDDLWAADQRDAAGAITADPAKFPSGERHWRRHNPYRSL